MVLSGCGLGWCSPAKKQALALPAALVVSAGAMLAHPVAAEAAVTPSLKNLLSALSHTSTRTRLPLA